MPKKTQPKFAFNADTGNARDTSSLQIINGDGVEINIWTDKEGTIRISAHGIKPVVVSPTRTGFSVILVPTDG